ncbi:MAG: LysR family transcriptional regulator [Adlercreutzia sp.]|nr:LysR family transcriptional regulator [Adlercreutzia sp.]
MDIRQLEYCLAVAQRGSFTKAADELFITRQALSKAVHNLEQELGEAIFVARDGSLRLTHAGEELLDDARPVVATFQELARRYTGPSEQRNAVEALSIALVPGAALTVPDDLFDQFSADCPHVLLSVENAPTSVALDMVAAGESDVALVGSAPQYLQDFDYQLIVRTGAYVHVPVSNPLSTRSVLTLEEVASEPFVTFGKRDHLHRYFADLCEQRGFTPQVVMTASNLDVLLRSAYQHQALMFGLPPNESRPVDPAYPLIPLITDDSVFGTYLVKRKGETLSSAAQAFWDYLVELQF